MYTIHQRMAQAASTQAALGRLWGTAHAPWMHLAYKLLATFQYARAAPARAPQVYQPQVTLTLSQPMDPTSPFTLTALVRLGPAVSASALAIPLLREVALEAVARLAQAMEAGRQATEAGRQATEAV